MLLRIFSDQQFSAAESYVDMFSRQRYCETFLFEIEIPCTPRLTQLTRFVSINSFPETAALICMCDIGLP